MKKFKIHIWVALLMIGALDASAQEQATHTHTFHPTHSVGLAIGHAHSFKGLDENGKRKTLALPYFGLDYNYQMAPKWSIGLHVDFINESFIVEKHGSGQEVERSRPIAPAAMAIYNLSHRWKLGMGLGGDFAKEGNYWLNRVAIEYACPIRKGWEVFGAFQYDARWNAYDTWTLGLGIAKVFGED